MKPGHIHTPVGNDSVPLEHPAAPRASAIQSKTAGYLFSMGDNEEALQKSYGEAMN